MELLDAHDLLSLTVEPNWADLDPHRHRMLALSEGAGRGLPGDQLTRVSDWIGREPVPVVCVCEDPSWPLADSVDLVVENEQELDLVARSIDKYPNASAVLVQVLRSVGSLATHQALALESLAYATLQGGSEFAAWLAGYRSANPDKASRAETTAPVLRERVGARLQVTLNSPADRNALSVPMRDALTETFKLVAMDPTISEVTVSGNGPCFSAGGDLSEFGSTSDLAQGHNVRMLRMPAAYLAPHAQRYRFRLHGACIGAGIELPAFAGHIAAAPDTQFRLPEVAMGLIPGAGGCVSIARRIGRQRTARMALLGDAIPAHVALEWGLIDSIVD